MDEDFAVESLGGDIFLLGNTSWRIRSVAAGARAGGRRARRRPERSFLARRGPGRTVELSESVAAVRATIDLVDPALDARERQEQIFRWAAALDWLAKNAA